MTRGIKTAVAAIGSALVLAVLIALAGLPLYVFPPAGDVSRADLVYVVGPPTAPRLELARQIEGEGVASDLLVSVSSEGDFSGASLSVCREQNTSCETPDPFTTKGEARMLTDYAAAHDVDRTVVLTFTPHVARTRYIFEKCYGGEVSVVAVDQRLSLTDWIYQYAYQSAAFAKAWATPCA